MYAQLAAGFTFAAAACKVLEITTGEAQRNRDEAIERAVEKHFDALEDNSENYEDQ